ncbi:hypothetical protein PQR67_12370 [Paraburkholderia fungorum]|uniref:hypothetical protein n=1 Tax=Paraburkholderia fungorum TaxID=134537 RepID=UPI0038B6F6BF
MIWPLDGSTPVQSVTASMEPTLSSQIPWRQFQIPFGGIRFEKIPIDGMYWLKAALTVPLHGLRKIPMNQDQVRMERMDREYSIQG